MSRARAKGSGKVRPLALAALSLRFLRPYRRQDLLVLLTMVVDATFTIAFYFGMKVLIDAALRGAERAALAQILAGLAAFFVAATLANLARERLQAEVEVRLTNDLRLALLNHLQRQAPDFYVRTSASDLTAQFSGDIAAVRGALARAFPAVVRYGLQLVTVCLLLLALEWRLACIVALALALVLGLARAVADRAAALGPRYTRDDAAMLTVIQEGIADHLVLEVFGLQSATLARVRKSMARLAPVGIRAGLLGRLIARVLESGVALIQLMVGTFGVLGVSQHALSVGTLAAFLGLLGVLGSSLVRIAIGLPDWLSAEGSLQRLAAVRAEGPGGREMPGAVALPRIAHAIQFADVGFRYPGGPFTVRHISLTIQVGQSVAFVGRNGSGKSTLLALLLRLWDPDEGAITVDGHDLRAVAINSLQSQRGAVFQETFLFNRSVRENIRLGRPATGAEIEAAAAAAQIHDVIAALPGGYDAVVGERGGRLSAGQRQRLALARALLHDPALLLLDEATASLDPAGEAAFEQALRHLAGSRTIVAATHRLTSVIDANRIFVLEQGRLVEQGTHQELVDLGGLYRELWDKQTGFLIDKTGHHARVTTERLRRIPLFATFDEDRLATLPGQFVTIHYDAGQVIIEQGEAGDHFYILVHGAAEVLRTDDGTQRRIDVLQDGDYFGEMALLADVPRTATVRALAACLLLALTRQRFQALLRDAPELRAALSEAASRREQGIAASRERA